MCLVHWTIVARESGGLVDSNFNPTVLGWTIIMFVLLLVALRFTAWPAIIKALDERERRIQRRFDEAEERVEAAEHRAAEYEARIQHIEEEARRMMDEARENSERMVARIQREASDEIERMLARARREIELAQGKAASELKHDVVDLSCQLVETVLEEQVSDEEHHRFVNACIDRFEQMQL
jgi:F-type H+-transporting ATPase subunit b